MPDSAAEDGGVTLVAFGLPAVAVHQLRAKCVLPVTPSSAVLRDLWARLHDLGQEDAAWDAWIEFFLTGIYEQAQANTQKVQAIRALYRRLQTEIIHLTKSAYAVPLLDSLFRTPIFSLPRLTLAGPRPSRPALSELLLKLKAAGIISVLEESAGRRAALYTLRELFDLCEGEGAGGPGRP
jgi:hypothetical protein